MTIITAQDIEWVADDGGRADAGYRGTAGDCFARSVAIAGELDYQHVYDLVIQYATKERPNARRRRSHPRTGVHSSTARRLLADLAWAWTPTMGIGTGTTVHLRRAELPIGRLVVACSRHYTAVIDGVVHDTYDPSRDGTRCVYGYWQAPQS